MPTDNWIRPGLKSSKLQEKEVTHASPDALLSDIRPRSKSLPDIFTEPSAVIVTGWKM